MEKETDPGTPLAVLVATKMRCDGVSVGTLAERLGISQSYLSQLLSGEKSWASVNDELIRRSADYVDQAAVVGFLLSGKLRRADFFESPNDLSLSLERALRTIARSQFAADATVALRDLETIPVPVQLLIVLLYESAIGDELIPGRVTSGQIESAGQFRMPFQVRVVKTR